MKTALILSGYKNIYCLQPGVFAKGGLLISPSVTLEVLQKNETRNAWLSFVKNSLSEKEWNQVVKGFKEIGHKEKDKFIVIYCSKDLPVVRGQAFIEKITEIDNKNYPVLLIGTKDGKENSANFENWQILCEENGLTVYSLPRTSTTEVLMCGLKDAEYSMATGSFSILEAKKLGLYNCAYLAPPHLQDFAILIEDASSEELETAFEVGRKALIELSYLPKKGFFPIILHANNALVDKGHELLKAPLPGLTELTDEVIQQRNLINAYMKEHMPEKYQYFITSQIEYIKYREEDDEEAHDNYIEAFAIYKRAFNKLQDSFFELGIDEYGKDDEDNQNKKLF